MEMALSYSGLLAFHSVAVAASFTSAARLRNVSQPTLSAQVRALEEAYGVRLFDRVGRTVKMTPLGQSLYVITSRLFAAQDEAEALLAGTRMLTRGHLRVAADSASHVMAALSQMRERYPNLTFSLAIGNSSEVLQRLSSYEADVAITARNTSDPRVYTSLLRKDKLVAFAARRHALAERETIPIEALAGQDIVLRERGSITREVFESRLLEANVRPGNLFEVQTREAVREAVASGLGIGVTFDSEFQPDERVKRIRITGIDLMVAEYAACLDDRRRIPLIRSFLEIVKNLHELREPSPAT
jgi:LysR family transcriptional regulator, low CO2-responsive transcriptional regulator